MKKLLFILALTLGTNLQAVAQPLPTDSVAADTTVVSQLQDAESDDDSSSQSHSLIPIDLDGDMREIIVPIVAIVTVCGLPLFIALAALWFHYRNKQTRYKLAEQALAAGQPIPESLLKVDDEANQDPLRKGIKNICFGIGLGVMLWAFTDEAGIAAIGFLIFCMGVGQVLIAYATRKNLDQPTDLTHTDEEK